MIALEFFTVGHSNHSIEAFLEELKHAGVKQVVDVRRLPGSNKHPQFNQDALQESLNDEQIDYRRISALGGRRIVDHGIEFSVNGFWENRSFHNYADYALSAEFQQGLQELIELGRQDSVAIMCSEAVWWRCHRRIITDHLLAAKYSVQHIMPGPRLQAATLTAGARVNDDGQVTYPAADTA